MEREEERYTHESFGQILFTRVHCRPAVNFYGSELPQYHYISMEIHNSEIIRELTQDRYYTRGLPIIRIRLSSGQFSELITSMNIGTGVPCTIERLGATKIQELPNTESRKEFVHRKFEDRMKMFADTIRVQQTEALALVEKKTLSKDDIQKLRNHLNWLVSEVSSNIPFFAKCFQETMDEVVFEAKLEIENAIQHKINVLGLEKLHEQNQLLTNNNE